MKIEYFRIQFQNKFHNPEKSIVLQFFVNFGKGKKAQGNPGGGVEPPSFWTKKFKQKNFNKA